MRCQDGNEGIAMTRKFTSIQKSCGWDQIYEKLNSTDAEDIFREAEGLLTVYKRQYKNVKGVPRIHVSAAYTVAALYIPLKGRYGSKKAKELLEKGAKPGSLKKKAQMEKMPSGMFLTLCRIMTNIFFGDKAGFINKDYSKDRKEVRFDILSCPYYNTLKELRCPEVCPVICVQDEYSYKGMKNCVFERTETIGGGGDKCNFCYRLPEK